MRIVVWFWWSQVEQRLAVYREDLAEWLSELLSIDPKIEPGNLISVLGSGVLVCRLAAEVHAGVAEWSYKTCRPYAKVLPPKFNATAKPKSVRKRNLRCLTLGSGALASLRRGPTCHLRHHNCCGPLVCALLPRATRIDAFCTRCSVSVHAG